MPGGHTTAGTPYATHRNSTGFRGVHKTVLHRDDQFHSHKYYSRRRLRPNAAGGQPHCHFETSPCVQPSPGAPPAGATYLASRACRSSRNRCFVNVLNCPQLRFRWKNVLGRWARYGGRRRPGMNRSPECLPRQCWPTGRISAINGFYSIHRPCMVHSGPRLTNSGLVCGFFASYVHSKLTQRASGSVLGYIQRGPVKV